ncbi:MAG: hypothetical protein WAT79_09025 [Saprospiraceae bacterium]
MTLLFRYIFVGFFAALVLVGNAMPEQVYRSAISLSSDQSDLSYTVQNVKAENSNIFSDFYEIIENTENKEEENQQKHYIFRKKPFVENSNNLDFVDISTSQKSYLSLLLLNQKASKLVLFHAWKFHL